MHRYLRLSKPERLSLVTVLMYKRAEVVRTGSTCHQQFPTIIGILLMFSQKEPSIGAQTFPPRLARHARRMWLARHARRMSLSMSRNKRGSARTFKLNDLSSDMCFCLFANSIEKGLCICTKRVCELHLHEACRGYELIHKS